MRFLFLAMLAACCVAAAAPPDHAQPNTQTIAAVHDAGASCATNACAVDLPQIVIVADVQRVDVDAPDASACAPGIYNACTDAGPVVNIAESERESAGAWPLQSSQPADDDSYSPRGVRLWRTSKPLPVPRC